MGREQEHEALLDVVDDPAALSQPEQEGGERVVAEDEVGGLARDRRTAAHRDRDVRPVERGGVVHAVAGHRDDPVLRPRGGDDAALLVGGRAGDHVEVAELSLEAGVVPGRELLARDDVVGVQPGLAGDRRGRQRVVPGDDEDLDPRLPGGRHGLRDAVAHRVREADEGPELPG